MVLNPCAKEEKALYKTELLTQKHADGRDGNQEGKLKGEVFQHNVYDQFKGISLKSREHQVEIPR